jgi:outer membrane protein OmpA-like peptidoglycan-associated protein
MIFSKSIKSSILLIGLSVFTFFSVFGQGSTIKKMESEADHNFRYDRNYEALQIYLKLDSLRPNNPKTIARIGICYLYHIKSRALPYLEKAKSLNYKDDYLNYYLARAYHLDHQFDKAAAQYAASKGSLKSKLVKQDVDLFIRNCADGKIIVRDSIQVKIENLGPEVNSEYSEYAPLITSDESMLVFTSQRPIVSKGSKFIKSSEDIYVSYKEGEKWKKAVNIGSPINTNGNDASVAFSLDGGEMFIYKSDSLNPAGGSIYISKKNGDNWDLPVRMNSNINSNSWEPSISISPNEEFLFFTSDRPGGFGGSDIYVSKKVGKEWGKAKNLGSLINTAYDEDAPFIHPDGKTLYFSSKGHPSIGGFDIYTATYDFEKDSIGAPSNIGYPINTADDEIFFIWSADGTRGYFSSTREDTYGRSDIYMVTRPNVDVNLILLSGNVQTIDNKIIASTITIVDNETNKIIGVYDSTKFKDKYAISMVPGKNYAVSIEAKGYLTYSENINIPVNGFHDIKKDIRLIPLDQGGLIVLKNVLFEPGKSELNTTSLHELDRYVKLIQENPDLLVEIAGHAFDLDDHKSNLDLSEKRAQAVLEYLAKKGAKRENLKAVGYGDKFKVSDDNRLNTRTEFIIRQALAKDQKLKEREAYYVEKGSKAVAEAKHEVENSIQAKSYEKDYLLKKDEDIYFGVNNSKTLKEFKVNEEVKEKVKKGEFKPVVLNGKITDKSTGTGLYSVIVITDLNGRKVSETKTSQEGKYSVEVYNSKEKKYTITVHTEGYNFVSKDVMVPANSIATKEIANNFKVNKLEVGQNILLRNIYFDNNSANFKPESYKELKKLETLLKRNKNVKVEISGHTDSKGDDNYNRTLSQNRADAVVNYLLEKGIGASRIIAKGYGEQKPLASNDDELEGRELNRRIEFEILQK